MRIDFWLQGLSNVLAGVIGLLLGVAIADSSLAFADWLFEWQTLLTGILAVGAAGATIIAMRNIDRQQHERHEEQIGLQLRQDRLRVDRARPGEIDRRIIVDAAKQTEHVKSLGPLLATTGKTTDLAAFHMMFEALLRIAEDETISAVSDLFDKEMFDNYKLVKTTLVDARNNAALCISQRDKGAKPDEIGGTITAAIMLSELALQKLRRLLDDLDQLANSYNLRRQ